MRFWLVEVPSRIVNAVFSVYIAYIAVLTFVAFVLIAWSLIAAALGWPGPW
jgi:hypothetical protein